MSRERVKLAAIYVRLSQGTEESVSIDRQLRIMREDAERFGYTVIVEGIDESVRASRVKLFDRTGWEPIEKAADNLDLLLFWEQSRVIRTMSDWAQLVDWAEGRGILLRTHSGELRMDDPQAEFSANIGAALARMESRLTSERVKSARGELVRQGRIHGGQRPWWSQKVPRDGGGYVLRPDPDRAGIIVGIVDRVLAGASLNSQAQLLNRAGLPSPRGGVWRPDSLKYLLESPSICGARMVRGELVRGDDGLTWIDPDQGIISFEQWERLRQVLASRKRGQHSTPAPSKSPLSGLLLCGTCGHRLVLRRSGGVGTYACARTFTGTTGHVSIKEDLAWEQYVDGWLGIYDEAPVIEAVQKVDRSVLLSLQRDLELAEQEQGHARGRDAVLAAAERVEMIEARLRDEEVKVALASAGRAQRMETFEEASRVPEQTFGQRFRAAETIESQAVILRELGSRAKVVPGVRGHVSLRLRFIDEIEDEGAS